MDITVCFEKQDHYFMEQLRSTFGNDLPCHEEAGMDGGDWVSIILSVTALTFQLIDFFKTHCAPADKPKRFIKTKEGNIYMSGLTGEEIAKVLESIHDME